jgi:hypothetical protein
MKLISENTNPDVGYEIVESVDATGTPARKYYITGIFAQAEQKNRNGRIYPKAVLESAVKKYVDEQVTTDRAVGELNHPNSPTIDYKEVSHRITELYWSGNDVMGKALILDTPNGKIVQSLLDGGVKIGVSTRGMGTVASKTGVNMVNADFVLNTVDIVQDPSAPSAYVNGIMEGVDWVQNETGAFEARRIEENETEIEEVSALDLAEAQVREFENFLSRF